MGGLGFASRRGFGWRELNDLPRSGESTLAHRGVLFMDELPEFPRSVLESLRQPLEDDFVAVARVGGQAIFPTRFQLVGTPARCKRRPPVRPDPGGRQRLRFRWPLPSAFMT